MVGEWEVWKILFVPVLSCDTQTLLELINDQYLPNHSIVVVLQSCNCLQFKGFHCLTEYQHYLTEIQVILFTRIQTGIHNTGIKSVTNQII